MAAFRFSLIFCFALCYSSILMAQQDPNYVFYRYQQGLINPAWVGIEDKSHVSLNIRSQWQGAEDSPQTQSFLAGTAVSNKVGLGLSVVNDKTFIEKQLALYANFSYALELNYDLKLYLGLRAGGNIIDVNAAGLRTFNLQTDPLLTDESRFNPNVGVGVLLKSEEAFVSLSSPRLFNSTRFEDDGIAVTEATDRIHIFMAGGYDFELNDLWMLKPSAFLRYVDGAPFSADFRTAILYDKRFELGLGYRTDNALNASLKINITRGFDIAYAYDTSLDDQLREVGSSTHEILLLLELPSLF